MVTTKAALVPDPIPPVPLPDFGYEDLEKVARIDANCELDVYRARLNRDGYDAAVTLLEGDTAERFEAFVEGWRSVDDHPAVVSIHEWGTDPCPWIAVERVGETRVADRLAEISVAEVLHVGCRVADAMDHAHSSGTVGFDLDTDSVLLSEAENEWGFPKVAGWAVEGPRSEAGEGTGAGRDPSKVATSSGDERSLYQFGTILYELLTGVSPDDGSRRPSKITSEVPSRVDDLVARCLAGDPADRPDDLATVAADLESVLDSRLDTGGDSTESTAGTRSDEDGLRITRRRTMGVLGASLVAGSGIATASNPSADAGSVSTDDPAVDLDSYPYGYDQVNLQKAKEVMEQAGYGPDNRYQLNLLRYNSPGWQEIGEELRTYLEDAYVDLSISSTDFDSLLDQTAEGEHEAYTLGWIADYPGLKNFVQLLDPSNTDYEENADANGARLFWSEDAYCNDEVRKFAREQFDKIADNPEPTEEALRKRAEAAVAIEEANWSEAGLIPIRHDAREYVWHDWVDYDAPGTMGDSRARTSETVERIDGRDRLSLNSGTIPTLDPVASGDTASGDVITDLYEGLMGYPKGQSNVENRLAESYEISDDLRTYTFQLKEDVEFHDGTELTAEDVVYSFRRLLESDNSNNGRFAKSVLPLTYETETVENEDGQEVERVVPGTLGVTATDTYEVEIELRKPFTYTISVLAYSAFAVVPEGIVGDVEGYDGETSYGEFATERPVGTGPFEFVDWEQGNGGEIVLDYFDDYHGNGANFEGVDRRIVTSPDTEFERFIDEKVAVESIPTTRYSKEKVTVDRTDHRGREIGTYGPLENGEEVNYAQVPELSTFYIGFNMEKVPKPVRQALAYVVDQESIAKKTFDDRDLPAYHLMPPLVYPGGPDDYESHYLDENDPVDRADEDGDGQIDKDELQTAIQQWATGGYSTSELQEIISAWVTGS